MDERPRKQGTVAGLALVGLGLSQAAADAATFTVTNLNDNGSGSLRQAIADANGAAGADIIDFQAGLTGTITLTTGQLDITDSVDIQGPGAATLAVSGNNSSRVFYLYSPSALIDVTLSGLTLTGGSENIGGAIVDFDENLTLDQVVITGNQAIAGGGLWLDGFTFTATLRDSTISGNTGDAAGGGIYVEDSGAAVLIQRTTISGNQAGIGGGGIFLGDVNKDVTLEDSIISGNTGGSVGGGIFLYYGTGSFNLRGTTISGNSAYAGGGVYFYGGTQTNLIENSTISGNHATGGDGGGVLINAFYSSFAIRNTTIAGNDATGAGGGLFTRTGPVAIENSILGDNTAGSNNDIGTVGDGSVDLRYTLVESPGTANIDDIAGNLFNQDPQLGPLQNNGGPTATHLPAGTSPAVNAGDPAFTPPPATDQRGVARVSGGRVDMGAVEVSTSPGTLQLAVSAVSVSEGVATVTITVTRTGGSAGAVSVAYATANGTATAPADYASAAGIVNFADGDAAPKTFQITIVEDGIDEIDETFSVTISGPTGGATLGAITTETVTIQDNDAGQNPLEVPTLGDLGKGLLVGLLGAGGMLVLRRRKAQS